MKSKIEAIIEKSLKQGLTESDLERLLKIKETEERWDKRETEGINTPSVNSNNQTNKHKNQGEDTEKILTIYDSEFYDPIAEKKYFAINPCMGYKTYKSFNLFAQYCVWSDDTELSSYQLKSYNDIISVLKDKIKVKHPHFRVRANLYCKNKINLFVKLEGVSVNSHAFADLGIEIRIPLDYLTYVEGVHIKTKSPESIIRLLMAENLQLSHLYK